MPMESEQRSAIAAVHPEGIRGGWGPNRRWLYDCEVEELTSNSDMDR
jgi:hypothetical protein